MTKKEERSNKKKTIRIIMRIELNEHLHTFIDSQSMQQELNIYFCCILSSSTFNFYICFFLHNLSLINYSNFDVFIMRLIKIICQRTFKQQKNQRKKLIIFTENMAYLY